MIDKNKQYTTRSGLAVRIYATDGGGQYPVHGAIYKDGHWFPSSWTSEGKHVIAQASSYDLIEVKPRIKAKGWVNVYCESDDGDYALGAIYATKEEATIGQSDFAIACIQIEIDCEEGEGL